MTVALEGWEDRLAALRLQWAPLATPTAAPWSSARAELRTRAMREERDAIVRRGQWLGGPAGVLEVLGVQAEELAVTRVLAWLLRPDGRHGLHDGALRTVLEAAGAQLPEELHPVRIVLEDSRDTVDPGPGDPLLTRADLVVYMRSATLVVESKVYAVEQRNQLDRLRRCWAVDVAPAFLYVTRRPVRQLTSGREGAWPASTWSGLGAQLAAVAADAGAGPDAVALIDSLRRIG